MKLTKKEIESVISCQQGAIEELLKRVFDKVSFIFISLNALR